jgi:peptide/nickel transport system permease protein
MILRLILTRSVTAILTLLAVSVIIFSVVELLPGDIAIMVLGRESTAESRAAFRAQLRLDRPAYERYLLWLSGYTRGDMGRSLVNKRPVTDIIRERLPNTLILGVHALLLYIPLSLLFAVISAVKRERTADHVVTFVTLIENSLPEFVVGTGLLLLFAVWLPIFPVMSLINRAQSYPDLLRIIALPTITLTISLMPHAVRMLRDNLIDVLGSDYVRMATLKGLSGRAVVQRHALPNALIPLLNIVAVELAFLIGGVVVVEQVFSYPGIGGLLVSSVFMRDAPVVEAVALLVSGIYIFGNLLADIGTILLSPRLRTS